MADQPGKTRSASQSPRAGAATGATLPAVELIPADLPEDGGGNDDADSALSVNDAASSTASITSSILEYRTVHGRTFHSDKYSANYFVPNDEQQTESIDIGLFLAPIDDNVQKVLDVGTGTGIWAIDFADEYPNAEVIGTDLSPIQPSWVPPNVKFELDDAILPWSWPENSFDFIHMRYLFGSIPDWDTLFKEAYRCCKPGGWIQSCEIDPKIVSDDGTVDNETSFQTWNAVFLEGGKKFGRSFSVCKEDLQRKGMENAGFVDIQIADFKVPLGPWPKDPSMSEIGQYLKLTMENDLEGYTMIMWNNILGWPKDEYQIFLMGMRKAMKNKALHGYMDSRYVYARKPEAAGKSAA